MSRGARRRLSSGTNAYGTYGSFFVLFCSHDVARHDTVRGRLVQTPVRQYRTYVHGTGTGAAAMRPREGACPTINEKETAWNNRRLEGPQWTQWTTTT